MPARAPVQYRDAGILLIRATTDPRDLMPLEEPDLPGSDATGDGRAWLATVWRREETRDAVQLASPALSRQIARVLAERPDGREVRRTVISLASYLLRWQGRATPFGLFAGVATVQAGTTATARWHEQHRLVARPCAAWLSALIGRLEQHPELMDRLPVVANNAAFTRGDRLVIPGQPTDGDDGQVAPVEVSIRYTRPVRAALDHARQPRRFAELVRALSDRYQAVAPDRLRTMLTELVAQHAVITGLRAPMTEPDALSHLIAQLAAAGADDLHDLGALRGQLIRIQADLAPPGGARWPAWQGSGDAMTALRQTALRMTALCDVTEQPLVVDVGLNCDISVPELVVRDAEVAACALLRLTPHPFGYPHWKTYYRRFISRHGTGAIVPVSDLVLADSGLGMPAGFLGSQLTPSVPVLTARDETILALVQHAVMGGMDEIALDDQMINDLTVGDPSEHLLPSRVELAFQVRAASTEAVATGDFRLVVSGVPRPGSSMAGRFADLLPAADQARLAASYRLPDGDTDLIAAQLSFPGRHRRSENVTRTPRLLPTVISVSEHRCPHQDTISLHDLAVTADARELYLLQISTGRRVEPRVLHALEGGVFTPALARFLAEVGTARSAVYAGFDWGAASRLPYLPRLRYGRIVLAPARWLLAAAELPVPGTAISSWDEELEAWRTRMRVPARVVLCECELRLPLSLDRPLHRAVLRARLARTGRVELREDTGHDRQGWPGRPHEFLLPLRLTRRTTAPMPVPAPVAPARIINRRAGHLPGIATVLHAQISGHPDRQDEILTGHLPRLLDGWAMPSVWWYTRHRDLTRPDSEQHLSLYLRLPPGAYGQACAHLGTWVADLRDSGLVPGLRLAAYYPETGRYGHGPALTAAEEAFAADSAAALAQIAVAARSGTPAQALTAASMADLACALAASPAEGMRWLIDILPKEQGAHERSLRDAALKLTDADGKWETIRALPGGDDVIAAWERRRTALASYRASLAEQRDSRLALRSLLHMHHVRSLGVSPEREQVCNRLARAAAARHLARQDADQPR
jgi:lantibiotic biosynthesis protein